MNPELPRPISDQSRVCVRRFREIEDAIQAGASPEPKLSLSLISDGFDRFRMWAGNIGAIFVPGRQDASLDLRLIEAPGVASQVLECLIALREDLDDVFEIMSGKRQNRVSTSEFYEEVYTEDGPNGSIIAETEELSEVIEIFQTAQTTISCLFRLSQAVRKATNRDRYATSARKREDPYPELFDIAHVGHKYPKLRGNPWLETRLGRAITRRREFIRYSKEHHHRLARGVEQLVKEEAPVANLKQSSAQREIPAPLASAGSPSYRVGSTLGSTKASTLSPAQIEVSEDVVDEEASESSYATTEITAENEGDLKVPPIPEQGKGGQEFVCPYCWTTKSFKGKASRCRKHWKEHALQDLRPYIHVAKHMRQLALFALPRVSDVGDESWESFKAAVITPEMTDYIDSGSVQPKEEPQDPPLHVAAYAGKGVEVTRMLEEGHDVDATGHTWGSVIGAALAGGHPAVIKLLVDNGADLHLPCRVDGGQSRTALQAAAAMDNPIVERILLDAEARNQRPLDYGEVKWKLESTANKLDTLMSKYQHITYGKTNEHQMIFGEEVEDIEPLAVDSFISASLRDIGANLDPQSDVAASSLTEVIRHIHKVTEGLDIFCDLVDFLFDFLCVDTTKTGPIKPATAHCVRYFNDSVVRGIRRAEEPHSLREFLLDNCAVLLETLSSLIKRAPQRITPFSVTKFTERSQAFERDAAKLCEETRQKLEYLESNKEAKLIYYNTYPLDPERFHSIMNTKPIPDTLMEYINETASERAEVNILACVDGPAKKRFSLRDPSLQEPGQAAPSVEDQPRDNREDSAPPLSSITARSSGYGSTPGASTESKVQEVSANELHDATHIGDFVEGGDRQPELPKHIIEQQCVRYIVDFFDPGVCF